MHGRGQEGRMDIQVAAISWISLMWSRPTTPCTFFASAIHTPHCNNTRHCFLPMSQKRERRLKWHDCDLIGGLNWLAPSRSSRPSRIRILSSLVPLTRSPEALDSNHVGKSSKAGLETVGRLFLKSFVQLPGWSSKKQYSYRQAFLLRKRSDLWSVKSGVEQLQTWGTRWLDRTAAAHEVEAIFQNRHRLYVLIRV